MPSDAYAEYQKNLTDVHRLVLLHGALKGTGRGRRGLGHLSRGGLLLLCAAWERYIETVAVEAVTYLARRLPSHTSLPPVPRQKLTDYVNSAKNAWTPAQLAAPTWSQIYIELVTNKTEALNTPKHRNLQPLFDQCLAVPDIANFWPMGSAEVDAFVKMRGDVAHRGGQSDYVRIAQLAELELSVTEWVQQTDNALSDHVRQLVTPHRRPWNRVL